MLLRSGSFMVEDKNNKGQKVSMKLMASLAPAGDEIEAGVVAKADQYLYRLTDVLLLALYGMHAKSPKDVYLFTHCLYK